MSRATSSGRVWKHHRDERRHDPHCPRSDARLRGTARKDAYAESFLAGACPIVGSYGAKDRSNRGTAEKLEQTLAVVDVDHDVKEYPDAGHAFLNDHEGAGGRFPAIFVVMGKFAGPSAYHEPSAADARRRIVSFFDRHLRPVG